MNSTGTGVLGRVAIVGRPNVGKSTLFNRIVGRREAIVEEMPGVTRDRKESEAEVAGARIIVLDTGGLTGESDPLAAGVDRQVHEAIQASDLAILVVDVTVGPTEGDAKVADLLHRSEKPVLVAVNKVDDASREQDIWAFLSLGLGEPFPVSAMHGRGVEDLLDEVVGLLRASRGDTHHEAAGESVGEADERVADGEGRDPREEHEPRVALVGRPNVGKSTLFNRLVGEDRSLVHDMPGTTRDAVDTLLETPRGPVRFVDTAGLRKRSRVDDSTEFYAGLRAREAMRRADVALLVIDATEGVTHQDQNIAEYATDAGCGVVIVLNKWDLVDSEARAELEGEVRERLGFLVGAPILRVSALTGRGVAKVMPAVWSVLDRYRARVNTALVNRVIRVAQARHPAPGGGRVLYATQGAANPPTFTLWSNRRLPRDWLRYLENTLRRELHLEGTPLRLRVRVR
ncbi:MAG: GTPase Der [Acidimicrobiales bacterium]|nr:MAG: GTPase Der [Acidimicrobiales bacterium]